MYCTNCGSALTGAPNFCGSCGAKVAASDISAASSGSESTNTGDTFSHYAHAFNSVFATNLASLGDIGNYVRDHEVEIIRGVNANDPESLMTKALYHCTNDASYLTAHQDAKAALDAARKQGLDLGRYWFSYGFALEQVQNFDDALEAHEESLDLGFGPAAFNFGRLLMLHEFDLFSACRTWKYGRDQFNDKICAEMLNDLEISPGVYQATVPNQDGGMEVLIATNIPSGYGKLKNLS